MTMAGKEGMSRTARNALTDWIWIDVAIGLAAGLVATEVTNLAQRPLKRLTPGRVTLQEKLVRPGASSSLVAARKLGKALRLSPTARSEALLGAAIHFTIGMAWGPVYGLLRRYVGLKPFNAAMLSGASMSLVLDEGLVPALGLSAANKDYHAFTRVRGLLAHLVYGVAVGLAAEGFAKLATRCIAPLPASPDDAGEAVTVARP